MSAAPFFTIVTPTRNAAASLSGALASVRQQDSGVLPHSADDPPGHARKEGAPSGPLYEYRIVDGASTDMTSECVHSWQSCFGDTLIYTSEADEGIYDAMNKGLAAARGRYSLFLGADDRLEPGALALAARELERSGADCLAGACRVIWPDGREELRVPRPDMTTRRYPAAMPTIHQSWIARTDLLRAADGFDLNYPIAADYELFLRLQRRQPQPVWAFTDTALATFTLGGASFDIRATANDYRRARIRNGRTHFAAYLSYIKNIVASHLHRTNR
jgi:glycosyltransferase involved in cell wall biosynthesis